MTIRDRGPSEAEIQKQVMEWFYWKHPDVFEYMIHIPNEGKRSPQFGKQLKDMGLKKGVSDLFIALPSGGYHGCWIEIKMTYGKPTMAQTEFLNKMYEQGYYTQLTKGFDNTVEEILNYCFEM